MQRLRSFSFWIVLVSVAIEGVLICTSEAVLGAAAWFGSDVDHFNSDPKWTSSISDRQGNHFGWSANTAESGGANGEVGGTFARVSNSDNRVYYADTRLSKPLTLNDKISARGKFDILNITKGWSGPGDSRIFIGHFSKRVVCVDFVGFELREGAWYRNNHVRVRLRLRNKEGRGEDVDFPPVSINGDHSFSYDYDPNGGEHGRLTATIDGYTRSIDLADGQRANGVKVDAFGIGIPPDGWIKDSQPSKTAQLFIDDVFYTGHAWHRAAE